MLAFARRFSLLWSLLAGLWLLPFPAQSQPSAPPAVVQGRVVDGQGDGLAYANVQLAGTLSGAATDSTGRFRFSAPARGPSTIRASRVGYAPATAEISLAPGDTADVLLRLRAQQVDLGEAVVTGRAAPPLDADAELTPLEAITTGGASGDLFRALQTLPGVGAPGDGAGLYVRGGDAAETKTLLDGAPVLHPTTQASPTGGSFGTVRPFLAAGTALSTGGFSARYGNALSGILAIDSKDRPQEARQYVNLSLAAASLAADQPLSDDVGLRLSGNATFTGLLLRTNGQRDAFATVPQGVDGTLGVTWDDAGGGQLKLTSFARYDRLGARTRQGATRGVYRSASTNQLHALAWTGALRDWAVTSSLSWSRHAGSRTFGVLDLTPTDDASTLRVDAERVVGGWTVRTGGVVQHRRHRFEGRLPARPTVLGPGAETLSFDARVGAWRSGGYVEASTAIVGPLRATAGVRTETHSRAGTVVDPRASLTLPVSPHVQLRAAWGTYHQFPDLSVVAEHTGTARLGAQRAQHLILGARYERDHLQMRVEGYWKPYRDLIVRTGPSRYANAGTGHARGLDVFARYGAFLDTRVSGWISYSLLDATRTQPRDRGSTVTLEEGPAPYDLTHQISLVGKANMVGHLYVGGALRATTGQPFTPVIGTERTGPSSASGARLPVDGPVGSARLPAYHRLDLQLSYYWPFGDGRHVVMYVAVNNVLDRANPIGVAYSADYATRSIRRTAFVRSVYAGVSIQL